MKLLVLSLLRVGDLAMLAPVLRDLRAQVEPGSRIDLLINDQSVKLARLIPSVDKIHSFDRNAIQKGLGEGQVPFFESYERVSSLIDDLNSENYDMVINLTHTRLSGWIASLIRAKNHLGLSFDRESKATFGSNWFRFLNQQVESDGRDVFHYNDVFKNGLGISSHFNGAKGEVFQETVEGREEANRILAENDVTGDFVCVQALTSDEKKNWSHAGFAQALKGFELRNPGTPIALLAAPFEVETLAPLLEKLRAENVPAFIAPTTFAGAYSVLAQSKLLITLDTSLKHLGVGAGTPILEICIGSSDPFRTGAYQDGAIVVSPKESCAPCVHSRPCHRTERFCAKRIDPSAISLLASELFENRRFQLETIAAEFADDLDIFEARLENNPFFALVPVGRNFTEASIAKWVDLASRKIYLNGLTKGIDGLGQEILQLADFLRSMHTKTSEIEWRHLFGDFERQIGSIEGRINSFKTGIRVLHGTFEDKQKLSEFVRSLINLRERIKPSPLLSSFRVALDSAIEDDISPPFTRFRRIVDLVNEIEKRTEISLKIVRTLDQQLDRTIEAERV